MLSHRLRGPLHGYGYEIHRYMSAHGMIGSRLLKFSTARYHEIDLRRVSCQHRFSTNSPRSRVTFYQTSELDANLNLGLGRSAKLRGDCLWSGRKGDSIACSVQTSRVWLASLPRKMYTACQYSFAAGNHVLFYDTQSDSSLLSSIPLPHFRFFFSSTCK